MTEDVKTTALHVSSLLITYDEGEVTITDLDTADAASIEDCSMITVSKEDWDEIKAYIDSCFDDQNFGLGDDEE